MEQAQQERLQALLNVEVETIKEIIQMFPEEGLDIKIQLIERISEL